MVHVYECGLTRSSSKGRVYCYHQFMHYCMSICLRCAHRFSNSQRQRLGLLFSFWQKHAIVCCPFHFLSDEQQQYCIGHDEHLDEAHRSTEAFSDLSSSCFWSKQLWIMASSTARAHCFSRPSRPAKKHYHTHQHSHPFETSPVLNGAIAWKSSKLPVNKPRPSLLSWGESYSTPAGRFWGKSLTKQRKVIKLHKTGTIPLTTLTRMLPLLCMLGMGRERVLREWEEREREWTFHGRLSEALLSPKCSAHGKCG